MYCYEWHGDDNYIANEESLNYVCYTVLLIPMQRRLRAHLVHFSFTAWLKCFFILLVSSFLYW